MRAIVSVIDAISEFVGKISAWALLLVGFVVCYEVIMRYIFRSPTSWVNEISLLTQVFVVFFASAFVLKHREMVTIELALNNPNSVLRKIAESFAFVILFCMTLPAIWFGFEIWVRAVESGHTTDTVLGIPKWVTEAAVWGGFSLLTLQGLAELWRIWAEGIPEKGDDPLEGSH